MSDLITSPNVFAPDDVYERLIDMHAGKSSEESDRLNARLILLLINHIGDRRIVMDAIALASQRPHQGSGKLPDPAG